MCYYYEKKSKKSIFFTKGNTKIFNNFNMRKPLLPIIEEEEEEEKHLQGQVIDHKTE